MCTLECFSFPQTQSYIGLAPSTELHIKTHQNKAEHFDLILSPQSQLHRSSCIPGGETFSSPAVPSPH